MLLNGSVNKSKDTNFLDEQRKLDLVKIALYKIARDTGEDDYCSLFILESEFDTKIKNKEIRELRGRHIWVWVIIPFSEDFLRSLEGKLKKLSFPLLRYLRIHNFNGNKYIIYPEKVEVCRVRKEICEILKEQHGIDSSYLSFHKWEKIQNSTTWIKSQIQITRELIASKLLKKYIVC